MQIGCVCKSLVKANECCRECKSLVNANECIPCEYKSLVNANECCREIVKIRINIESGVVDRLNDSN